MELGYSLEALFGQEPDPALGNGDWVALRLAS